MRNYLLSFCVVLIVAAWTTTAMAAPEVFSPTPMYPSHYTAEEQTNLAAAETLFNAFAVGDMDTFFGALASDVVWEINGSPEVISSHGAYYGVAAVQDWVADLSAEVEFLEFGTDQFFADGDTVIVLFHDSGIVRATGKMIDQREVAVITYEDGKVVNFLCFDDSAQELLALTPDE